MANQMTPDELRETAKRLRHFAEMGTGTYPSRSDVLAGADALDRQADGVADEMIVKFRRRLFPLGGDTVTLERDDPWTAPRIREALEAALGVRDVS